MDTGNGSITITTGSCQECGAITSLIMAPLMAGNPVNKNELHVRWHVKLQEALEEAVGAAFIRGQQSMLPD